MTSIPNEDNIGFLNFQIELPKQLNLENALGEIDSFNFQIKLPKWLNLGNMLKEYEKTGRSFGWEAKYYKEHNDYDEFICL